MALHPALIAGTAALLLTACAPPACTNVLMPPPPFDHEPIVPYTVQMLDDAAIVRVCGPSPACSQEKQGTWDIFLPSQGVSAGLDACYERHEKAHINGWPANHPGGTYGHRV